MEGKFPRLKKESLTKEESKIVEEIVKDMPSYFSHKQIYEIYLKSVEIHKRNKGI